MTAGSQYRGNPAREDQVAAAARRAAARAKAGEDTPEPSLGRRLGQIGVLGWTIVTPVLIGLFAGRWLDRLFSTKIQFSATLLMIGAAVGLWSAWKWMRRF